MILSLVFIIGSVTHVLQAASWSYDGDNGPANWHKEFPLCKGKKQSPIDIITDETNFKRRECISLQGYDEMPKEVGFTLLNNGHSVQITLSDVDRSSLFASVFGEKFEPWQFHFHWGSKNEVGSEHKIDGKQFPAEMHFVHLNTKYRDATEALKHQDGLLVLGTFIKIGEEDNKFLKKFLKRFKNVEYTGQNVSIPAFKLSQAFGDIKKFYYYGGSLTTPDCNQAVQWVVFENPISMSKEQIGMFRKLKHIAKDKEEKDEEDSFISDNFRPTQDVNNRKVYRNYREENEMDVSVEDDDSCNDV